MIQITIELWRAALLAIAILTMIVSFAYTLINYQRGRSLATPVGAFAAGIMLIIIAWFPPPQIVLLK